MACTDTFASAQDFASFWCFDCTSDDEEDTIEGFLSLAAADVHAHLAAVGACDCTLASWATNYLKKLVVIEAAVIHNCPCGSADLTPDEKRLWLEWLDRQYELIRTGKVDVCDGATGAEFPALDWAVQGTTEFAQAEIILQRMLRS